MKDFSLNFPFLIFFNVYAFSLNGKLNSKYIVVVVVLHPRENSYVFMARLLFYKQLLSEPPWNPLVLLIGNSDLYFQVSSKIQRLFIP